VYIFLVPEYILAVDVLQGLWLDTTVGEFWLRVCIVKIMAWGHPHHPPGCVPASARMVCVKECKLPRGHEAITGTIEELEKAKMICSAHSPYDSPIWPVQKPDGI
jgi:hypothetical protein